MHSPTRDLRNANQAGAATVGPHDLSVNKHAGLLLLTLKEKHRLAQTSVKFAVQQVQSMLEYALEDVKASVEEKLQLHCTELGIQLPDISDCFASVNPFSGLESEHMQTKFYKLNCKFPSTNHFSIILCNFNFDSFACRNQKQ